MAASTDRMPVILVAGARPNFVKLAPLMTAFGRSRIFRPILVHTGQHYDELLSDVFFQELGLPLPDHRLDVGSGSQAQQTARAMVGLEEIVGSSRPGLMVVVGDVNSTLAGSLVAAKACVPLAHVEAGLRSGDPTMPEEVNRRVTDALSDWLFVPSADAVRHLTREGKSRHQIFLVGNVMIDTLKTFRERARGQARPERFGVSPRRYALLTLHRPSNVDDPARLARWLDLLEEICSHIPVIFPLHPRTRQRFADLGLAARAGAVRGLILTAPLPYLEFLDLQAGARLVLTDSGGIQEETTVLGVPCLTLRENTERPVTIRHGTNRLAGTDPERVERLVRNILSRPPPPRRVPPLWDGRTAPRIVKILETLARSPSGLTGP